MNSEINLSHPAERPRSQIRALQATSSGGEGFENFFAPEHHPAWKRGLDLTLIFLLFPILAIVFPAIALWIKFVGKGRVFFEQERVGYRGRVFTIYKFRSMRENAATEEHEAHVRDLMKSDRPLTKLDNLGDTRLIPGGGLLRKSGLDELPQLLNVLRGEMSLVGPRPCLREEYAQYSLPQRERFNTEPGMTGHWQVSGKNRTTFREMVDLDVEYVRNKSIWMDLVILFKTPLPMFAQVFERKVNQPDSDLDQESGISTENSSSP